MIILAYALSMVLLLFGLVASRKEKKQKINKRIASMVHAGDSMGMLSDPDEDISKLSFTNRVLKPIWKQTTRSLQKNITKEKKEKLELRLLQAGSPFRFTAVEFRMLQLILLFLFPSALTLYAITLNLSIGKIILIGFFGLLMGVYLPRGYLNQKSKARNKQALKELPDFLDLVTVSIEAGLGFDSALSKVVAKKDGVLSQEFQRCLEEMRLGKTRREALTGVRERLVLEDVRALIGSIIQAEQLGIGMVQIMRVQSDEIRQKRKQRAEEQAMKAPIKMLFPLVMFIFPCIFIVLLGPAVIQFLEMF